MSLYFVATSGRETPPQPILNPHGAFEMIWTFSDQPPGGRPLIHTLPRLRRVKLRIGKGADIEKVMGALEQLIQRFAQLKEAIDTEPTIITVSGGNGG